jgi:tetratricopeptide (TPR) repeat protein
MTSLAGVLAKRGQLEEAWTVAENALRLFEQTYGRAPPDTAFAHATLADILLQRGRYREAETRYARALAIREKGGADPHVIAATLQMVAAAQVERGNAAAADASLARALALVGELADEGKKKRDVDGETSALVAAIFETRSAVRLRQDRAGDAAADAERALALREKQGAHNPTVAGALLRLAQAKGKQGRTDEARAALERALRLLPAGHPDVPLVLTELAAARLRSGERHDAESLLQRALALPAIATGPAGVRSRAQVLLAQARR